MRAEFGNRMVVPVVGSHLLLARGMIGIPALAVGARSLAADQQDRIGIAVVHHDVGEARAGLPADEVAFAHRNDVSVKPTVDRAGRDIDELFFVALGMGIGGAPAGLENFEVKADAGEARALAEPGVDALLFGRIAVSRSFLLQDVAPLHDDAGTARLARASRRRLAALRVGQSIMRTALAAPCVLPHLPQPAA